MLEQLSALSTTAFRKFVLHGGQPILLHPTTSRRLPRAVHASDKPGFAGSPGGPMYIFADITDVILVCTDSCTASVERTRTAVFSRVVGATFAVWRNAYTVGHYCHAYHA